MKPIWERLKDEDLDKRLAQSYSLVETYETGHKHELTVIDAILTEKERRARVA